MAKAKATPPAKKLGRVAQDILDGVDEVRRHLKGEKTGITTYLPDGRVIPPAVKPAGKVTTSKGLKANKLTAGVKPLPSAATAKPAKRWPNAG